MIRIRKRGLFILLFQYVCVLLESIKNTNKKKKQRISLLII